MNSLVLRQLTEEDSYSVSHLRRQCLRDSYPYIKDLTLFNWGPTDRNSIVYGIFTPNELLATLRLEKITNLADLELRFGFKMAPLGQLLPFTMTSRGATTSSHRKIGLYTVLKLACFLKSSLLNFTHTVAVIKNSSFQHQFFSQIGYRLIDAGEQSNINYIYEPYPKSFGILNLKESSLVPLFVKHQKLINTIQWPIDLHMALQSLKNNLSYPDLT